QTSYDKALQALASPDCAKHFNTSGGGMSPVDALKSAAAATDSSSYLFFGSTADFVGGYADWQGTTSNVRGSYFYNDTASTRGVIIFNPDVWSGGSATWNAGLLIHELGHLYDMVTGLGGSDFVYDAGQD